MRKTLLSFFAFILIATNFIQAQTNLPYTLDFTSDASFGSMAKDGQGGTSKINNLNIEIFAADATSFNLLPDATMVWHDNTGYFSSSDNTFHGVTPGPDLEVTDNGVPALVIKSDDPSHNFSLKSIEMYDWGGAAWKMSAYDNGTLVGAIDITFNTDTWPPKTITQSDELTPALFNNIDEIRITPAAGNAAIWPAVNNIALDNPVSGTTPVTLQGFEGKLEKGTATLQWQTGEESNFNRFELQTSTNSGAGYATIATIAPKGNNSSYSYELTQTAAIQYYRLKMTDNDGSSKYSDVVTLSQPAGKNPVQLFPNPAGQYIYVTTAQNGTFKIFTAAGQLVKTKVISAGTTKINIADLAAGVYYGDINNQKIKFIKE